MVINLVEGTTNVLKDNGSSELDGCIYSSGKLTIKGNGKLEVYGNQEEGEGIATTDADITINGGEIYIVCNDDGINAGGDNGGVITINGGNITVKASGDGIDSNKSLVINGGTVYTIGSSLGGDAGIDTDKGFAINGGTVIALGSDMLQNPDATSKQKYVSFNMNAKIDKDSNSNTNPKTALSTELETVNQGEEATITFINDTVNVDEDNSSVEAADTEAVEDEVVENSLLDVKEMKRMDRFTQFACVASDSVTPEVERQLESIINTDKSTILNSFFISTPILKKSDYSEI